MPVYGVVRRGSLRELTGAAVSRRLRLVRPSELIDFYGSQRAAGVALGVTFQAISKWKQQGYVPYPTQCEIQVRTAGRFVAVRGEIEDSHPDPRDAAVDSPAGAESSG